jgi:ribosome-binding factor A
MANFKEQKVEELLKHLAADFLLQESNPTSLITVTGIRMSDKMSRAAILITVFPVEKEEEALDFTKRKRTEFKAYVREHVKMRMIPFVDFEIDVGEKNRQRIEELSE